VKSTVVCRPFQPYQFYYGMEERPWNRDDTDLDPLCCVHCVAVSTFSGLQTPHR
jgi:hypothetical protein